MVVSSWLWSAILFACLMMCRALPPQLMYRPPTNVQVNLPTTLFSLATVKTVCDMSDHLQFRCRTQI